MTWGREAAIGQSERSREGLCCDLSADSVDWELCDGSKCCPCDPHSSAGAVAWQPSGAGRRVRQWSARTNYSPR